MTEHAPKPSPGPKLSPEEARLVIKAIEEIEREEAAAQDEPEQTSQVTS